MQPPSFAFGALYRLGRWTGGRQTTVGRPMAIAAEDGPQPLFDEGMPPHP
ncbi:MULTISPECIES: hypothetical protein [Paraburkholderia]|nr:hypothetical protein [Paraburkholderia podalyriae]